MKAKFEKGQKVNYLGNQAEITSVKYNVFSEGFTYSVKYYVTNQFGESNRHGQSGVEEYLIK